MTVLLRSSAIQLQDGHEPRRRGVGRHRPAPEGLQAELGRPNVLVERNPASCQIMRQIRCRGCGVKARRTGSKPADQLLSLSPCQAAAKGSTSCEPRGAELRPHAADRFLPDVLGDEGGPLTRDKSVAVTPRVRRRPQRFAVRGLVVDNRRIRVEDGQVVSEAPTTLDNCATPLIQQCLAGVIVETADTLNWGRGNAGRR